MRASRFYALGALAITVSASTLDLSSSTSLPVATSVGLDDCDSEPISTQPISTTNATIVVSSHSPQTAAGPANTSATTNPSQAHSTATPEATSQTNATSSKPADATGGAILPQMQGSMAGLLGFCIMSLMLL